MAAALVAGAPARGASIADAGPPAETAPEALSPAAPAAAELDCLAQAIYYEAGGEARAGREAVAQVVLNRLHHPAYPKTVCGVVFQGAGRATGCQFTFACDGARARRRDAVGWRDAETIATDALAGRLSSAVGGSTHYHATWMRPAWSYAMTPTLRIGGHQFYVGGRGGAASALAVVTTAAGPAPQAAAFSVWGLQIAVVTPERGAAPRISAP